MKRTIKIGSEDVIFGASAALPIEYRNLTGREFFADMPLVTENGTLSFDIAWVMYRDGNPDSTESEMEWLRRFSFADLNDALITIVNLLMESQVTQVEAKKKKD